MYPESPPQSTRASADTSGHRSKPWRVGTWWHRLVDHAQNRRQRWRRSWLRQVRPQQSQKNPTV